MGKNNWCLLRSSETLKYAIEYRVEQNGLKVNQLAKRIGVLPYRLYNYLQQTDHEGGRPSITQKHLIKLAEVLEIKVELKVGLE